MPAARNLAELNRAEEAGRTTLYTWRKRPTQATGAGVWFDLAMSPGNPPPLYYASAPGVAAALRQSTDGGFYHGVTTSPWDKRLLTMCAFTAGGTSVPLPMHICDYLLYYPFIDMSVTDEQPMVNAVPLPRYAAQGGQVMALVVAGQSGGGDFFIRYTNQAGVPNRVTPLHRVNAQALNATLVTTQQAAPNAAGPFMALQAGDTSVKQIDGVTFTSGDVGLLTFVIVKPLQFHSILETSAPVEQVNIQDFYRLPKIEDDAFLGAICCPMGSLSGADIHGYLQTIWN